MASQDDDLGWLDALLFRLASADTDERLAQVLDRSLPTCLAKLGSQRDGVRKKVMELLVHVNKRVKDNHAIQLPVQALLQQYKVIFSANTCSTCD